MSVSSPPDPEAGQHPASRRDEVQTKVERVRGWLAATGTGGALLTSQASFAWITAGGHSHITIGEATGVASVLVTLQQAVVLTTNIERRRLLDEELAGLPLDATDRPWDAPEGPGPTVATLIDPSTVVSDLGVEGFPQAPSGLVDLRYTLMPAEVGRYRRLGREAAEAVEAACLAASPGDREVDVAAGVAFECQRRSILPLVNLVAVDERVGAYRHPLPTSKLLRRDLLVALTGRRHGLHASLTRMVSFGEQEAELVSRHDAVTRVDARMIIASRPSVALRDVFVAAAAQYAAEGFPLEWRHHHQGGLTGYAGREVFATATTTHRLEAGQALAWNPSIRRTKSEDTVLVTDGQAEVLTLTAQWPRHAVQVEDGTVWRPSLLVR